MTQEQLDILNEVRVKMFYDPKKTLAEQETRLTRDLDRTFSTPEGAKKFIKDIEPYKHEIIQVAALGSLFIPLVGPLISLGLDIGDASLYAAEGDKYNAGLLLAFGLIPFGELITKVPAVKKIGRDGLANLLKKTRTSSKFTQDEIDVLKGISNNLSSLKGIALKKIMYQLFLKLPLSKTTQFLYLFSKKHPTLFNLSKIVLQIGGIKITFDKLAQYYGLTSNNLTDDEVEKIQDIEKKFDPEKTSEVLTNYIDKKLNELTPEQRDSTFIEVIKKIQK
jgi:hypothetical protein